MLLFLRDILELDKGFYSGYYLVNLGDQYFVTDYNINKRIAPMVKG